MSFVVCYSSARVCLSSLLPDSSNSQRRDWSLHRARSSLHPCMHSPASPLATPVFPTHPLPHNSPRFQSSSEAFPDLKLPKGKVKQPPPETARRPGGFRGSGSRRRGGVFDAGPRVCGRGCLSPSLQGVVVCRARVGKGPGLEQRRRGSLRMFVELRMWQGGESGTAEL